MPEVLQSAKVQEWKRSLDSLASLYADIERRSFTVPTFSLVPMGIYFWATLKFVLSLGLDILLVVPMNAVIAIRNVFPGRWAYRTFSGRYFNAIVRWIRNGEAPVLPSIVIRPLTFAILSWHFHERLSDLRRRVIIDSGLDPEGRALLIADADRLLLQWPAPKIVTGIFTFGLPLLSPLAALYQNLVPSAPVIWTRLALAILLSYAFGILASAFVVKRGLMLGAEGRAAYFPGFLDGSGAYGLEQKLLAPFGVSAKEFPLSFALALICVPVQLLQSIFMYDSGLYAAMARGSPPLGKAGMVGESMAGVSMLVLLGLAALIRQRKLARF